MPSKALFSTVVMAFPTKSLYKTERENVPYALHPKTCSSFTAFLYKTLVIRQKKKIVMLPSPDQNLKIGSVGRFFFFFFTYRERVEFSNIFFKVSKWGKLGRNAVKTHIQVLF